MVIDSLSSNWVLGLKGELIVAAADPGRWFEPQLQALVGIGSDLDGPTG